VSRLIVAQPSRARVTACCSVTARPSSAAAKTSLQYTLGDESAGKGEEIASRLRQGPPERQPDWGERSPSAIERSRRLTRPTPSSAYAFDGGMLAPGVGEDEGKASRGMAVRASPSPPRPLPKRKASPKREPLGGTHRSGFTPTQFEFPKVVGNTEAAPTAPKARPVSARRRVAAPVDPQAAYVHRLESQVSELRDTLSLLAQVNAKEIEQATAKRQSAKAPRASIVGVPARSRRASKRAAEDSEFSTRVLGAAAEVGAQAKTLEAVKREEDASKGREAQLARRQARAAQLSDQEDEKEEEGAESTAPKHQDAATSMAKEEEPMTTAAAAASSAAVPAPVSADEVEGWAKDDEEWVRNIRAQYLDKASKARKWAMQKQKKKTTRPQSASTRGKHGATPRYMLSAEEAAAGEMTITRRRFLEEKARLEEKEKSARTWKFKAKPVPASTRESKYERVLAEQATRRRLLHEARAAELKATMKPFEGVEVHAKVHAEKMKKREMELREMEERALREASRFRANPVPPTTREADAEAKAREEREAMRDDRVKRRARQLLNTASLPPRMALHQDEEAQKRLEQARKAKREAREEYLRNMPRPTDLPDFERMQKRFESTLTASRASRPVTQVTPFSFDGRTHDLPSSPSVSEEPKPEPRPRRASLDTSRLRAPASEFRVSMTRSAALRMQERQRVIRERQEREAMEAWKNEQHRLRQAEVNAEYGPIFQEMEARRRPEKLAWQLEDDTPEAEAQRRAEEARFKENWRALQQGVQEKIASRQLLCLSTASDAPLKRSRQALASATDVLSATDGAVRDPLWESMRDSGAVGDLPDTHFGEDDKAMMTVDDE
jgi:hypothetical protein